MSKIISVIGGSGYVGKRCIQTLLSLNKDIKIYAISRTIRTDQLNLFNDRVELVKGDALNPESISPFLEKSSGVIHTVGKLISFEPSSSDSSYYKINYESAMKVAEICDKFSVNAQKNFVYFSADRGLMFPFSLIFKGYIENKRKAETRLLNDFKINPTILRPGLITDSKDRPYLYPLSAAMEMSYFVEKNIIKKIIPNVENYVSLPPPSIELDTLCLYACAGALGKLKGKIFSNDYMKDLNNLKKIDFLRD